MTVAVPSKTMPTDTTGNDSSRRLVSIGMVLLGTGLLSAGGLRGGSILVATPWTYAAALSAVVVFVCAWGPRAWNGAGFGVCGGFLLARMGAHFVDGLSPSGVTMVGALGGVLLYAGVFSLVRSMARQSPTPSQG